MAALLLVYQALLPVLMALLSAVGPFPVEGTRSPATELWCCPPVGQTASGMPQLGWPPAGAEELPPLASPPRCVR